MGHALTRWPKGSVRNRLRLPDCLRASGPGSYIVLWRSCIGPPSQPKLALSLPIKGLTYRLADRPRMTSVRREEIEAALVMGWPLDSVILNAVKNLGAWRG